MFDMYISRRLYTYIIPLLAVFQAVLYSHKVIGNARQVGCIAPMSLLTCHCYGRDNPVGLKLFSQALLEARFTSNVDIDSMNHSWILG